MPPDNQAALLYNLCMQKASSKLLIFLLTAGCFLAFFVFGFTDNLKGPTLPLIIHDLQLNYSMGGAILFGGYFGFLVATLLTGFAADRFGLKFVFLSAGVFLAVGVGGYSIFNSSFLLTALMFVIGLGFGALELGPNALIVELHHERKGLYLNMMAVFHGLGSMIAPLYAGWLLSTAISWRFVYRWDLILIAVFLLYFLFVRFPGSAKQGTESLNFNEMGKLAFKRELMWFYTAIALYVAVEIGMSSWMVTFLQEAHNVSVSASTRYLSAFFALIMAGRFFGGFVVKRAGYLRSIFAASIAALACILIGLFGPEKLSFFLPITGLFFSIVFPTITAAVSDLHTQNINSILGLLFTFAGLGAVIGPWLIGVCSDFFGLHAGFSIILLFSILFAASIFILMKGQNHDSTA